MGLSGNGGNWEGLSTIFCIEGYHLDDHLHHKKTVKHNGADKVITHSANELCSFDKKHVLKHFPNKVVTEVDIQAMSLTLIRMYNVEDVRMLIIDTEGFDADVITSIPFNLFVPKIVVFEHVHLSDDDHLKAEQHLLRHCYKLYTADGDSENTYALHKSFSM